MIILGIDQAAVSGWCIAERTEVFPRFVPKLLEYGLARKATERRDIIARAQAAAAERGVELAVVYEAHTTGGRAVRKKDGSTGDAWNPRTILGMGATLGRWLEALDLAGVRPGHVIGVEPSTWRSLTIGNARRPREEWKRTAVLVARGKGATIDPTDAHAGDIAEAVLIALWGVVGSAEVAKIALAVRRAERST